jgi:hypothetical protein
VPGESGRTTIASSRLSIHLPIRKCREYMMCPVVRPSDLSAFAAVVGYE